MIGPLLRRGGRKGAPDPVPAGAARPPVAKVADKVAEKVADNMAGRLAAGLGQLSPSIRHGPGRSSVGTGLTIVGNLEAAGDIEIHGQIVGDVIARAIVLAPGASIEGSVIADSIDVLGTVTGPVTAINVTVRAAARVIGKITHHQLTVEPGGVTEGLQPWQPEQFFTG